MVVLSGHEMSWPPKVFEQIIPATIIPATLTDLAVVAQGEIAGV